MEGYTPPQPESFSGDDQESSKETKKKKKRSPETAAEAKAEAPVAKKEEVAEKSKSLLDKWLGGEETAKPATGDKPEDIPDEAVETESDSPEAPDVEIERLTPEEIAETELFWTDARLEELYAGAGHDQSPEDTAARQASITFYENQRQELIDAVPAASERPADEPPASPPEIRPQSAELSEQPVEIDEDEPVVLSTPVRSRTQRPAAGASNLAPVPAETDKYMPDYRTNPNAAYLLVGGLVGYFIGRRRGRIKTERQMKRVQEKLEEQIEDTQRQFSAKEAEVQRLARENYRQKFVETVETASPRREPKTESKPSRLAETKPLERLETDAETSRRTVNPEQSGELDDREILAMAEKVKIGETDLRQIYEAKLVTESGLRRLVNEHLAGNDVRRALAREFLAKELSYERDPQLRDALSGSSTQEVKTGRAVLPTERSGQPAQAQSRSRDLSLRQPAPVQIKPKAGTQVSAGLLVTLTLVAIGLAIFAIVLSVTR